jgi:hypothetical protein
VIDMARAKTRFDPNKVRAAMGASAAEESSSNGSGFNPGKPPRLTSGGDLEKIHEQLREQLRDLVENTFDDPSRLLEWENDVEAAAAYQWVRRVAASWHPSLIGPRRTDPGNLDPDNPDALDGLIIEAAGGIAPTAAVGDPFKNADLDITAWRTGRHEEFVIRIDPLVADGTLALLTGRAGSGKTWFALEALDSVATGKTQLSMPVKQGKAMLIDTEQGKVLTGLRFGKDRYSDKIKVKTPPSLDLSKPVHQAHLRRHVREFFGTDGGLLVVDSLKRSTPSAKENESDDMAPIVIFLAALAREVGVAIILINHSGWEGERSRGSSVVPDQADVAWFMKPDTDDAEDPTRPPLRLTCTGFGQKPPRWVAAPNELWFQIQPDGGLASTDKPPTKTARAADAKDQAQGDIVAWLLDHPGESQENTAKALDKTTDDRAFRGGWKQAKDQGVITGSAAKGWTVT